MLFEVRIGSDVMLSDRALDPGQLLSGIDCAEAVAIANGELPNYPFPGPAGVIDGTDAGCGLSPGPRQSSARASVLVVALGLLAATLRGRRTTRQALS
jgi:hypothetical protein